MFVYNKRFLFLIFSCIISYKFLLEVSYITFLNPLYSYYGYTLDLNFFKFFESWFFVILILVFFLKETNKPSKFIMFLLFCINIIPFSSIYWLKNENRLYFYAVAVSFLITILLLKYLPLINFDFIKFSGKKLALIFFICSSVITAIIFLFNGLPSLSALNLNNVYTVRDSFNYGFSIMQYLVTWQANVINIFLMLIGLLDKKKILFVFTIAIQIVLYLYTGHKSFIFLFFVVMMIVFIVKKGWVYQAVLLAFPCSVLVSLITYKVLDFIWVASLTLNRIYFLPAQISFQYYEFFSQNGLMFLQHSIFEIFSMGSIYPNHPIEMIGLEYYDGNWPNTGYIGDAYMNFGVLGIVMFSILLAIILKILDSTALKGEKHYLITMAFSILFILSLTNTALLTALLTNGLGLFLVTIIIYKNDKVKI